AGGRQYGFGL
nr:allatostatin:ISOTYPE=A2 [Gryllus bimaculatus]